MPLFILKCETCGKRWQTIARAWLLVNSKCECGESANRDATGPSTQVLERLDNGAMPRALERLADAERLYDERNRAADPLAGGAKKE